MKYIQYPIHTISNMIYLQYRSRRSMPHHGASEHFPHAPSATRCAPRCPRGAAAERAQRPRTSPICHGADAWGSQMGPGD